MQQTNFDMSVKNCYFASEQRLSSLTISKFILITIGSRDPFKRHFIVRMLYKDCY